MVQAVPVSQENVGTGTGTPFQTFTVANIPVVMDATGLLLEVQGPDGWAAWQQIDDIYAAVPDATVYMLDPASGLITGGSGLFGARFPLGAAVRATYRYGGGLPGQVAIGAISKSVSLPGGFSVSNPVATWGASDAESTSDGEAYITRWLRHRDRLVTSDDFSDITRRTPGVDIGRVDVLPLYNPDGLDPTQTWPGMVTVLVIPQSDPVHPNAPVPDLLFLNAVCSWLNPRRLVTTEVHVRGPLYQQIWVSVGIEVLPGQVPTLVQQAVTTAVQNFLSPLTGGLPTSNASSGILAGNGGTSGSGWPLSTAVRSQDIEAVATRVPGVRYVDSVLIAAAAPTARWWAGGPGAHGRTPAPRRHRLRQRRAGRGSVRAHRRQPGHPAHSGARARRPSGLLIRWTSRAPSSTSSTVGDWGRCTDAVTGQSLATVWAQETGSPPSVTSSSLEYDQNLGALRLRHDLPLFRRAGRTVPLDPSARRGAGRDAYGNWYWIGDDQASIRWRPTDDDVSASWWSASQLSASCADAGPSLFASCPPPPPTGLTLAGLAVTTHHFLAAGYVAADEQGLLLFDLQAGGAPMRLVWPAPFAPFDLADTPDGGLLVLDRQNAVYFQLDEHFRLRGQTTTTHGLFRPAAGGAPERFTGPTFPSANPLYTGSPLGPISAISIEPGRVPGQSSSSTRIRPAATRSCTFLTRRGWRWSTSLANAIEVIDATDPTDTPQQYSLLGLDFAYLVAPPATGPLPPPMLYIADAEGQQVVAFSLDATSGALEPQPDFLPLRRWDGKALVRAGTGAWYNFGDRWVPLEVYTECRFEQAGSLTTPVDFAAATPASTTASPPAGVPGQTFDSQLPGCVWHRLLLDALVPNGTMIVQVPLPPASPPGQLPQVTTTTSLVIRARAADDPALLAQSPWLPQPVPYLRTDGAELAWYDPWADQRAADGSLPAGTGTYELLFQQVRGRYLQVELSLAAGGRSSPAVRSLRAWYPRFSYPENYLPAVYRQDAAPYGFLERFLANFEGFYTVTEERIEHSSLLLDARTTPPGDLAWLASWFGLVLDPQWNEVQQRFLVRNVDRFYRCRGTPAGLLAMLLTYLDPHVDDSVFDCGCDGTAGVRIVERFLTRDGGGGAYGDPAAPSGSGSEADRVAATAHRFDVLVAAGLSADALAMIERIVAVNAPAHTSYVVRGYYDLFIVGQARLGLDTQLGSSPSFSPMVVGQGYLAGTYLGFPHPFELTDRIVIDRDRVGGLSPL